MNNTLFISSVVGLLSFLFGLFCPNKIKIEKMEIPKDDTGIKEMMIAIMIEDLYLIKKQDRNKMIDDYFDRAIKEIGKIKDN